MKQRRLLIIILACHARGCARIEREERARRKESGIVLEVTEKQLKRVMAGSKKSTLEISACHDINKAGDTLPTTTP